MSTQKFSFHLKPFKNKIVDNSPLTVQIKHKTVKSEMFAFILIKPLLQEVGFEPTNYSLIVYQHASKYACFQAMRIPLIVLPSLFT